MLAKKKIAKTAAATFGAAMATLNCAPELQADIVDLTFSPGTVPFNSQVFIYINEVGASFAQWNDSVGQSISAGIVGTATFLDGVRPVQYSQSLAASTFPNVGYGGIGLAPFGSGTAYFGFHFLGNVGWFAADLGNGNPGDPITYLGGQYGTLGETVHVGLTQIPEPSCAALAALALGAAGVRRRKK